MKNDTKKSGIEYVTPYGKNSSAEDFADSVAEYFTNKDIFVARFPERAALLKEIFKNG